MILTHADYARCARCHTFKPRTDFNRSRARASGVQSYCRPCHAECDRAYRQTETGRATNQRNARRTYRRAMADPERAAAKRAQSRESQRVRRARAAEDKTVAAAIRRAHVRWWKGVKRDPVRLALFNAKRRGDEAAVERWLDALAARHPLRWVDARPLGVWLLHHYANPEQASVALGVHSRALRRYTYGESKRVSIEFLDGVVVAADVCLHDIYDPIDYPELFA